MKNLNPSVKSKFLFLLLIVFLSITSLVYSFEVCNVNFDEPWFLVSDSSGSDVLVVDSQGDMYFGGEDHSLENSDSLDSFEVGDNIFFNDITSKFSSFSSSLSSLPSDKGLVVRNTVGVNVSLLSENGDIYTKGLGAYEGSQGDCSPDGWLYCNSDGVTRESRDYYCDITGNRAGSCTYNVDSDEDCSAKLSDETDSGNDKNTRGTVTDYTDCSSGSCNYDTYTDSCISTTTLLEYIAQGSSYTTASIDCSNDDSYYCDDLNRHKLIHECDSGACYFDRDVIVETCSAPSTDYGSWSCDDEDTKVRSNVEYSASCSPSGCDVDSTNVLEYDDCGSDEYCSGGNCNAYTYSWESDSWSTCSAEPYWGSWSSCTVSCGGGIQSRTCYDTSGTETRSVWCERDQTGEVVSDSYCSGSKPSESQSCSEDCSGSDTQSCNTQSCCDSHHSKSCYGGDVYWYDSCGNREDKYDDCGSDEYCSGGSCNGYTYLWESDSWSTCSAEPYWGSWSSCTVSCGGGTQSRTCYDTSGAETRSVWCERDQTGEVVSDSYCSDSKPSESQSCSEDCSGSDTQSCNTQSCCDSHHSKSCYGGDVYWYDSCGNREDKYDDCGSDEKCEDGSCVPDVKYKTICTCGNWLFNPDPCIDELGGTYVSTERGVDCGGCCGYWNERTGGWVEPGQFCKVCKYY